jgi:regulatory protein
MEPHRPPQNESDAERPRKRRTRADALPLDVQWVEREGLRYVARVEATRRGVEAVLERKLLARCERTSESPDEILAIIPDVVSSLVDKNYIDDRRFAEHVFERSRRQGRSIAQIRAQLRTKGIEDELAQDVERRFESDQDDSPDVESDSDERLDPELEAAFRTARKRRLGPYSRDPSERAERRERHLGVLARQGFSSDIAHRVIDAKTIPENPEHES